MVWWLWLGLLVASCQVFADVNIGIGSLTWALQLGIEPVDLKLAKALLLLVALAFRQIRGGWIKDRRPWSQRLWSQP